VLVANIAATVGLLVMLWRADAAAKRARRDELDAARSITQLMGLVFEVSGAIPHHCDCGRLWLADRARLLEGTWHMGEGCVRDVEAAA
jgi:hypothetical protein